MVFRPPSQQLPYHARCVYLPGYWSQFSTNPSGQISLAFVTGCWNPALKHWGADGTWEGRGMTLELALWILPQIQNSAFSLVRFVTSGTFSNISMLSIPSYRIILPISQGLVNSPWAHAKYSQVMHSERGYMLDFIINLHVWWHDCKPKTGTVR